ncbi:CRISPR system precrRNA processing endoribonuclease RAMP protein Cas6 [Orenia marismortui]|uniref:CRISPR-associated endoribonuclease Cas6 n=1 Tax=Orenia marismortui TaxID=46469 RepID=A0A4R8HFX9_9FIRM|nr:CRISPR system precrRNA processing endoribonuclease RAMP protein Cas6 [Orenia marismortui]TDX59025.1 CRISPR-associated endoribonuclease Cas6 [Orenia marismortui]
MKLAITQLTFTLIATQKINLPIHPGSTFRGAFGNALKKLCCNVRKQECKDCNLNKMCPYSQLFNPHLTEEEQESTSTRFNHKPRPFIFEPKTNGQQIFYDGQEIRFNLNLFGYANKFLPYIIESWKYLQNQGIGLGRGKFTLSEVWNINDLTGKAERIYSEYANMVHNSELKIKIEDINNLEKNLSDNYLRLKLITPMLLKHKREYINKIEFYPLMKNLFRRISELSYFYGKEKLDIRFSEYLEKAKKIQLVKDHTKWENWQRYSNKQKQRIKMYGVIGELEYQGGLAEFLPYLILGQYTHIGKNTVFGLGNYKIIKD